MGVVLPPPKARLWKNTIGKSIVPKRGRYSMANIYQKLQAVQAQTGKISRTELNKFQNYKYFTEQQALNILKPLLEAQKLTLTFSDSPTDFAREKTEKE
jgi:hypothetical protein